jgi:hypothetical protein
MIVATVIMLVVAGSVGYGLWCAWNEPGARRKRRMKRLTRWKDGNR